jgi:hypothetical protein
LPWLLFRRLLQRVCRLLRLCVLSLTTFDLLWLPHLLWLLPLRLPLPRRLLEWVCRLLRLLRLLRLWSLTLDLLRLCLLSLATFDLLWPPHLLRLWLLPLRLRLPRRLLRLLLWCRSLRLRRLGVRSLVLMLKELLRYGISRLVTVILGLNVSLLRRLGVPVPRVLPLVGGQRCGRRSGTAVPSVPSPSTLLP